MMRVALVCSFAAFLFSPADAGSFTCDSEYGALCPEESPGEGLVACLRKAGDDGKELSEDCKGWLSMWEACGDEIGKFCAGNEAEAGIRVTDVRTHRLQEDRQDELDQAAKHAKRDQGDNGPVGQGLRH